MADVVKVGEVVDNAKDAPNFLRTKCPLRVSDLEWTAMDWSRQKWTEVDINGHE